MKLEIIEPSERHAGPILVCDETHNDIAEFFHNEHATVGQSYETALGLARALVAAASATSIEAAAYDTMLKTGVIPPSLQHRFKEECGSDG